MHCSNVHTLYRGSAGAKGSGERRCSLAGCWRPWRAAEQGPVFITDRGRIAFALLKIEDYYQLAGHPERSLLQVMEAIPGGYPSEFEAEPLTGTFPAAPLD